MNKLILIIFLLAFQSPAYALGLKIVDCTGQSRAARVNPATQGNNVEVDVIDKQGNLVSDQTLTLTNNEGKTLKATIKDGTATFYDVPEDVWVISSESNNLLFTNIAFSDFIPPPFWSQALDVATAVGVVAGGIVVYSVIENATDGGGGNNNESDTHDGDCVTCDPNLAAPSIPQF